MTTTKIAIESINPVNPINPIESIKSRKSIKSKESIQSIKSRGSLKSLISSLPLLPLLLLVLTLSLSTRTWAQTPWDGTSASTSLSGDGTADNPYLIQSAEDLKYLQKTTDLWGDGKYFEQTTDINLGDESGNPQVLGMIGTTINAFKAIYDGKGYVISNLKVDWTNITADDQFSCYGLFGYVLGGKLKNIIIDKAKVTRSTGTFKDKDDTKAIIGVLVGSVGNTSSVENIIIRNSTIDDGGTNANATSYMVGGAIGDLSSAANKTDEVQSTIKNIYAQVDIDMSSSERRKDYNTNVGRLVQFNVGGIVGRIRSGGIKVIPQYTIYTGKIKAPTAMVSPTFGMSRWNGSAYNVGYLTSVYAGHNDNNAPNTESSIIGSSSYNNANPDADRYFYDYKVYNSGDRDYVTIDENWLNSHISKYGTHTFVENEEYNKNNTDDENIKSGLTAETMQKFQGVNHGTYFASDALSSKIEEINTSLEGSKYFWELKSDGTVVMYEKLAISVTRKENILTATVHGADGTDGTWEWRGLTGDITDDLNKGYVLDGSGNTLSINANNNNYNTYYAIWKSNDGMTAIVGFWTSKTVVYVYDQAKTKDYDAARYRQILNSYPDGNDNNHGRTPNNAVKTMKRAYEILAKDESAVNNIIVVMGYLADDKYLSQKGTSNKNQMLPKEEYKRNATITGTYGEITTEGTLMLHGGDDTRGINGATVFKDITLNGANNHLFFYCNLNDLTIGSNVKVKNYKDLADDNGQLQDSKAPFITIVGGMHQYNNTSLDYPSGNAKPGCTTIKIQSGNWGRIIASGRNNGQNETSNNIFGHPNNPHRVIVEIAIKHTDGKKHEYCPGKEYTYDIGMLVGGQTDGTVYVDSKLYMSSGSVGRFVAGNISFGRKAKKNGMPSDGFYGSTELTFDGGEIKELVGGTLGRHKCEDKEGPTEKCEAYFYGRTILNINGGVISSNIYGAGAGGVTGIGDNEEHHTKDKTIPYFDGTTLKYGDFDLANGNMPKMTLRDDTELDLAKSYTEVNINGGTILGNVYGAGYGYSEYVAVDKALDQAGDLFGSSYVRISGGTIKGNVYGGGAGADDYYKSATSDSDKEKFKSLANIYGDTSVDIAGGIIEGCVYAGSKGIQGLPDMATVYGSTNLTVRDVEYGDNTRKVPIINNNIYGGSELGRIIRNTNVKIEGGAIGNCIFGGSEGIAEDANKVTAYIDGNTNLTITGGTYFTDNENNKISENKRIEAKGRTFNIYGGGYNNCIVSGSTNVIITKSLLSSYKNLLEEKTFTKCVQDETYRKFSVYAAGRGILTDVLGNANLTINITDGASVPSAKPVDVANDQQFFMISGGGFAGNVYGNTNVTLSGNVFARRVYGGGMYGRIEGKANLTVEGGSYYSVYGGGLLGDIKQGANLTIGKKADGSDDYATANSNRNIYIYENVYGGNDVGGIVGYKQSKKTWTDNKGYPYKVRYYDNGTWRDDWDFTLHESTDECGVDMKIYGGNILGDVFGAGNGNHTGYYVPNNAKSEHYTNPDDITRMKYHEGPAYLYRFDKTTGAVPDNMSLLKEENKIAWGLYEYRPRVNKVCMHIGGNSVSDRVHIGGSVFGGGLACTIGKFDPDKDVLTNPSKFQGGGSLEMNFGSHVTVKDAVYMGSRGRIIGEQTVIENEDVYKETTLNSDYDYHYYDKTADKYLLGFPNTLEGRNRFHAYMKLIDMDAPTKLTFLDNDDNESTDVRWGSFFAGGARGSMTYNTDGDEPCYEYTLPAGLTVETRVVGGSEDAQVVFYEYKDDYKSFDTSKPIFTYKGGIVHDTNTGEGGHFGGGVVTWQNAPTNTDEKDLEVGDESPRGSRTVMKLTVNCQFDPQEAEAKNVTDNNGESDGTQYWGGLVYGGCYNSGITNGSVEVECTNTLLGNKHFESNDFKDYLSWSSLRRNVGRIYGGGFGKDTEIWGNTKVTLSGNCRAFNVFGGGMKGNVTGGTEINIRGYSLVYNAVYGGGMEGDVGKDSYEVKSDKDLYAKGTYINAISGGIDRIYGGAFMGNVYGGTHISISDEKAVEEAESNSSSPIRLMVGSVYGGNDVMGVIHVDNNATMPDKSTANPAKDLSTYINVTEKQSKSLKTEDNHYYMASNGYAGYPMVGTIYGAGNGNLADYVSGVTINREDNRYAYGKIHIANGNGADYEVYDIANKSLPDVDKAKIDISGGTILNVYAGGNMCTTKESNNVTIQYNDTTARAAFLTSQNDQMTWGLLRLFESLQKEEVTSKKGDYTYFSYQIYRVFGGNNLMDMAIQPTLDLQKGNIFSVYSGGNFGKMTYYNKKTTLDKGEPRGLSLTVNSPNIRIASIYGGGRVGDIDAGITFGENDYGATLNIKAGVIGDVYGGNNVAGTVHNGTNVNISGAISGNVYGSGNGNYIYLYDQEDNLGDPAYQGLITEGYDANYGGRYFILPYKSEFANKGEATDEDKLLVINSYRPNVNKAYLNIQGTSESQVYVLGNVFCGGNSSTVLYDSDAEDKGKIKFEIGSYVTLGGVFLGSNGEGLANPFNITYLANLNGIDDWSAQTTDKTGNTSLYPNLLSLYMRAAEVTALPSEFSLPENAVNAHIGNFCVGGNFGSMMTDKTINITLPEKLVIFGRVVGGCYNSRIDFQGATALGGMTKPLADGATDKLNLTIKCDFLPLRMVYDAKHNTVSLVNDRTNLDGDYVSDKDVATDATYYYREGLCNIFGGCYTSGKTVGNIKIDLYSDMLGAFNESGYTVDRSLLKNNVGIRRTVYALCGAGYGALSEVEGNTLIRLLPTKTASGCNHPSVSTIFGGAHNGAHIGNATTEIRDGMVFSNLYGGSRAAIKYGSSEVIVGYPTYYKCKQSGTFTLKRADEYTEVAKTNKTNADGTPVIKKTVKYREGDIVAANVVDLIEKADNDDSFAPLDYFDLIDNVDNPSAAEVITPTTFGVTWDDISIHIGDNRKMDVLSAPFYGGGGIYGGGHAINASAQTYSGINTQLAYTKDHNPDNSETSAAIGYGGNSTIIVGDNTADDQIKSHISIGTGHYVVANIPTNGDKIGTYKVVDGKFVHQPSGTPETGESYYRMETAGGIYGDGRRTFVENFRAVDITGYGYADYSPQSAKLINTFQRIDLLSLNDCCLQLQGAQDYATNSIDATPYSIARIGELRLNSTLTGDIKESEIDPSVAGNIKLDEPRSRNYMGFFNNVHYLGAIYSNTAFTSHYRGIDGKEVSGTSYKKQKKSYITTYETDKDETNFKKRNLATAPNMIGINNGYTLRVTNAYTTSDGTNNGMLENVPTDNVYYGPIVGVVEVKLLTLAQDEGGGYIYAFNHHEENSFLEDTGNFVYPAAIDEGTDNYIVDDCYPLGYYANTNNATEEEAHYWYVTGHNYYYNTTLTAYTYNKDISFKLNNTDNIILLSGITKDKSSTITVESIDWEEHVDNNYQCALTNNLNSGQPDSRENYKMYLTISDSPGNEYDLRKNDDGNFTNTGNAFVARIPNGNAPEGGTAFGTDTDGKIESANTYDSDTPLLGIRLFDTDHDNQQPAFFHEHLSVPDNLVIKIKAKDADEKDNTYTIRLNIVYLQGPYIDGKVAVENCALPGEYIYANTGEVQMEMDDALTVTGKKWFLYPRVKNGQYYDWDKTDNVVDVSQYLLDNIAGDINRIQLPARYYQNDWKIGYSIIVNGIEFPLSDPDDSSNRLTVHNYHRMSTVAKSIKLMTDTSIGIGETNYGYDLDLDLVGGALVYIDDNKDFEIFTKYINYCNSSDKPNKTHPGYNANGNADFQNVKDPQGGENIRFVLNDDITLSKNCMPIGEFRGILSGKGHIINLGKEYTGKTFITTNNGELHDIGFVSEGRDNVNAVISENNSLIENSFYFRYNNLGNLEDFSGNSNPKLINTLGDDATADNCYQNSNSDNADAIAGVRYRTNETFQNGMIAYNLNQHYLKLRCRAKDIDSKVRETMEIPTFDDEGNYDTGDYLYRYYANGDYRFAHIKSDDHPEGVRLGVPNYEDNYGNHITMHITDLDQAHDNSRWFSGLTRNDIVKRDERGNIIYVTDTDGNVMPDRTNEGYFPIYLYDAQNNLAAHSDFIFFGQTLSTTDERDYYPQHISNTNRVYRAGGHYGSRADYGFHFNRDCYAMQPKLTAIDFTGQSDLMDTDHKPKFMEGWNYYLYNNQTGETATDYTTQDKEDLTEEAIMTNATQNGIVQFVYYPPVLDLPGGSDNTQDLHEISSFHIDTNADMHDYSHVTKNLLVYTPEIGGTDGKMTTDDNTRLFEQLYYTRMQRYGDIETDQNDIIGHHIEWVDHSSNDSLDSHFHAHGGLFHLVDAQNFNAPVPFYVAGDGIEGVTNGRAWMKRLPAYYATRPGTADPDTKFLIGRNGWESISLPFTCNRVLAVNANDYIEKYSRGQITHFYGTDPKRGITHHDYWLRGLVAAQPDTHDDDIEAMATFARPGKKTANLFEIVKDEKDEQMKGDYTYNNNWFGTAYPRSTTGYLNNEYADTLQYLQYHYLTKNAPYIVAFPGSNYYEFDLSGAFYNRVHGGNTGCHEQEIIYEYNVDEAKIDKNTNYNSDILNVRIPVTDVYDEVQHTTVTNGDYTLTHNATFMRIAGDDIKPNMYVLNTTKVTDVDTHGTLVTYLPGSVFINCKDFGITEILPFRTYITAPVSDTHSAPRFITLAGGTNTDDIGEPDEQEPDTDNLDALDRLTIAVDGNTLLISSSHECTLPLHSVSGQLIDRLTVHTGNNAYHNIPPGIYIVGGTKFIIKR